MNPILKLTWLIWLLFTIIIVFCVGHHHTVSINYWQAANHWLAEQPLYENMGRGFIYLPQSAMFYALLTPLPFAWSEAIWRVFSLGIFSWGLFRFTTLCTHKGYTQHIPSLFLLLTILVIPLCFDSARNGQAHLLNTGLLMLATAAIGKKHWQQAVFLMVLAMFIKPTAIVFLLLTAGVFFAETGMYILFWGAVFMLMPFFTASWGYVIDQFLSGIAMLKTASGLGHSQDWAQIFNLVSQTGWEISQYYQNIVRIFAAAIFLLLGYLVKKTNNLTDTAIWLLMLAMNYLVLFNPRTENNDYMMLVPVVSYCVINSIIYKKFFCLGFLILITCGLIGSFYISNLFPGHRNWCAPLMGVALLGYLMSLIAAQRPRCSAPQQNCPISNSG